MKLLKRATLGIFVVIVIGYLIPQNISIPVEDADDNSYHPESFWYYPWGNSVTHKGVDIFAKRGTVVKSSTPGIVFYRGRYKKGGNVVIVLGPKWRFHYYAHLDTIKTSAFSFVNQNETIGTVGISGNAAGKPPHLHYSIVTLLPYIWRIDGDRQGWKKMFYLNPISYF